MKKIWLTSDTHFFHHSIIEFCKRPFKNVDEMNEALIEKWNAKVRPEDDVFFLGDFSMGSYKKQLSIFNRLNGAQKFLIKGNHDKKPTCKLPWTWVKESYEIRSASLNLSHYPHLTWNKSFHGVFHIFGHVHSYGKYWFSNLSCDVGVDYWNYEPVEMEQIVDHIRNVQQQALENGSRVFLWRGPHNAKKFEFLDLPW